MNTTKSTEAKMIARRVSKGHNAKQSADVLTDIIARHSGDNLASALVYNSFATARTAERFAGIA